MCKSRFKTPKYFLLAAAFFFLAHCSTGNALALDPRKAITQYIHDVWQKKDGLPGNFVHAITQTRDGYIWLGTNKGLARFNGVRFTLFDEERIWGIKEDNRVRALLEDRSGSLWIGTQVGGLRRYKNGIFTTYTTKDGLSSNHVRSIYEDRAGNLWIGTEDGLNRYNDGKFTRNTTEDGLTNNWVWSICEDRERRLWVGTVSGLSCYKEGKFTAYTSKDGLSNNSVLSVHEDHNGNLWVGTEGGGLNLFKGGKFTAFTSKQGLPSDIVTSIKEDKDGNLWLSTDSGGLVRLSNGTFTTFSTKEGLSDNSLYAICEDREGSLWIGTNEGLNRLRDGNFSTYTTKEGLSNDFIGPIYEDRDGNLWIGTIDGLDRLKDGKITTYTTKEGLSSKIAWSIYEDREGNLLVGTDGGGLNRLKDGRFVAYATKGILSNNPVSAIYQDWEGSLWIGTWGGGLSRFRNGEFTLFTTKEGLSNNIVYAIYEDREKSLWIGTAGGLSRFKDGKFTTFTTKDGLSSERVMAIDEDSEGVFWIATKNGLTRLKDSKFTTIDVEHGLYDNLLYQILEDGKGNLWISSSNGVFRVSIKELNDFAQGKIRSVTCAGYGKADGMRGEACAWGTQPSGCRTGDGRLWFPTGKGVVTTDPDRIRANEKPSPLYIERTLLAGREVTLSQNASLAYNENNLSFEYALLSYFRESDTRYRTQLLGFDAMPSAWTTSYTKEYTNLGEGDYIFNIWGKDYAGNISGPVTISLHIRPAPWRTWWAYALYFACFVGIVYGGFQYRLKAIERRNQIERAVEIDRKNRELESKNEELARINDELSESHKRADRIFSALAEALPGTVLDDKYRLDEKIGSGGFGVVYRASHLAMERSIAIKIFKPTPGNDSAEALERFRLEAVSACRINHPNAVAVLDSGISTEGIAYLVMELLEGHTLTRELRHKKTLSIKRAAQILIPVCDVLSKAHSMGIVHRDIKPDNIFLHRSEEGETVKVVDFGIAKLMETSASIDIKSLTGTGGLIGTPTYMAPERFEGKPYDGRADVYSLGVMLYEMLCGQVPFESRGGNVWSIVHMHLKEKLGLPREINPSIPVEVEAVILRALEKDPNKRPTAMELGLEFLKASGIELEMLKSKETAETALLLSSKNDAVFVNSVDAEGKTGITLERRRQMEKILNSLLEREPNELAAIVSEAEAIIAAEAQARKGSTLAPERWKQIEDIVYSALECEPDHRVAFLDEACGGDEALRRKVESLIAAYESDPD